MSALVAPLKKRGNVYLLAQPTIPKEGTTRDLSPLAKWGDITVVTDSSDHISFKPEEVAGRIRYRLQNFDAENDYLVWAGGDTLAAVMVGAILRDMGFLRFWWLRFERGYLSGGKRDPNSGHYTAVEVVL